MIWETLAILVGFALLELIGIGPALWLVGAGEKRLGHALGVAPAVAIAILGIIGFPLVKYVAPVQQLAIPVTIVLAGAGTLLAVWYWLKNRRTGTMSAQPGTILAGLGFVAVVAALLSLPILFLGIQYTVFRSNPSDAFFYMSLAETARTSDWQTIQAGAEPSLHNLEGMSELASVSPTSLLTARFMRPFAQLGMPTMLAWFAQVVGLPIYKAFYSFHILIFLSAGLVALVLADILQIPVLLKFLAATAVAAGFWAHFIFELGSSGEVSSIPVLLLCVFAWIQLEQEPLHLLSPSRLLLGIAATALVCFYTPIALVFVFGVLLYYVFTILLRQTKVHALLYQAGTLLLVFAILLLTGQLDNIFLTFRFLLFTNVAAQERFQAAAFQVVQNDFLAGAWGLPRSLMVGVQSSPVTWVLRRLADVLALVALAGLIYGAYVAIRKPTRVAEMVILAMVASGLILFALLGLSGNERPAGKALGYIYPYLILGAVIPTSHLAATKYRWLKRAFVSALALWLGIQILWSSSIPFIPNPKGLFEKGLAFRNHSFQVQPIESYLDANPPRQLLVNVPRDKSWVFAFYTTFVFQRYPAYFQSGLVMDNSVLVQNVWYQEMPGAPDYALMLKSADYLHGTDVAMPVAETADLVLYRVTSSDPEFFLQQEQAIRNANMALPFHEPAALQ